MPATDQQIIDHLAHGGENGQEHDRSPGQSHYDTAKYLGETEARVRSVHRANAEAVDRGFRTRNGTAHDFTVPSVTIGSPATSVGTAPESGVVRTARFVPDADFVVPGGGAFDALELDNAATDTLCYLPYGSIEGGLVAGEAYDMVVYDTNFAEVQHGETAVTSGETIKVSGGGAGGHATPAGVVTLWIA